MRKMMAIYKRDLKSYFLSPIAYILIGIFLMLLGFMFFVTTIGSKIATMDFAFQNMIFIFLFISPLLTMRLMAEEKRQGTNQLLFTSPVKISSIVGGKFLAAFTVYMIILLVTLIYPAILYYYSRIDLGPVLSGYLGAMLLGGAFIAVGLFASSLTENQIIAAVVTFAILLLLWSIEWIGESFQGTIRAVFEYLSAIGHFDDFQSGIIDTSNIVYYLSLIFVFLYLTIRVIEKNWSRG